MDKIKQAGPGRFIADMIINDTEARGYVMTELLVAVPLIAMLAVVIMHGCTSGIGQYRTLMADGELQQEMIITMGDIMREAGQSVGCWVEGDGQRVNFVMGNGQNTYYALTDTGGYRHIIYRNNSLPVTGNSYPYLVSVTEFNATYENNLLLLTITAKSQVTGHSFTLQSGEYIHGTN